MKWIENENRAYWQIECEDNKVGRTIRKLIPETIYNDIKNFNNKQELTLNTIKQMIDKDFAIRDQSLNVQDDQLCNISYYHRAALIEKYFLNLKEHKSSIPCHNFGEEMNSCVEEILKYIIRKELNLLFGEIDKLISSWRTIQIRLLCLFDKFRFY